MDPIFPFLPRWFPSCTSGAEADCGDLGYWVEPPSCNEELGISED